LLTSISGRDFVRGFALAGVAIASLMTAPGAFAQADAQTPDTTDDSFGEIVVTAQRRSENIQNVPLSVSAVRGDDLRALQSGGEDILALSGKVPGLYAETTTGRIFPRFYIRGLGNIDFYLGASQPVSIVQDDVVLEHVVLKSNPVYDVAQVEVLRGPQGSLFGRNTTAGIIKFDTIRPGNDFQARAQASYGSYNTVTLDAGVGGALIDGKLAVRVSGLIQHRDDWVDNIYNGASADGTVAPKENAMGGFDDRNIRLQLLATPSETVSILLSGHARDYDGTSTIFHRAALTKGSNSVENSPRSTVALDEANNNPQAYKTYGGSAKLSLDLGIASITSITAYETTSGFSRGDTDGGAAADFGGVGFGQSQGNVRDLDQWTQELRVASNGDGPFKWQFGGIYFDSRDTTDFYQRGFFLTTAARNPNNWVRLRNTNTSQAVFGQASYLLTPQLTLSGGIRITEDEKRTQLLKTADTAAGVVNYRGRRDVSLSDTQPSWDLSALYEASDDVNLYARVARGFRGPTIQGRSAVFNADFTTADSETNLSWEAGFKSNLFDNSLRFNASAFYYTVSDIQLNGNDSNGNGVLFNADKAVGYGAEAEIKWQPIDNLSIGLGLSWLHSEIKDDRVYAQVCAQSGVVVCTVNDPTIRIGNNVFAQIDGNPLPNAPEYNIDFTARYDQPLSNGGNFFLSTDWNKQGFTSFVLYESEEFNADGNFEGGLKLGYQSPGGDYEVALFARNITNEKNLKGVIENFMAAVYNDPRIFGISLNLKTR
jgi:iron complex outermembrane recepter protein